MKEIYKEKAIDMRKEGFSYSEILSKIPVAKSTLSLWLRGVGLSKRQQQRLTNKKIAGILRGAKVRRDQRIKLVNDIYNKAQADITDITFRELWILGIGLYWGEGSKEKAYYPGSGIVFNNSDPNMIVTFLKWLQTVLLVDQNDIVFEIYIHENSRNDIQDVISFWSDVTGFSRSKFNRTYFKSNVNRKYRKNITKSYYGTLRVKVKKSSTLLRKVMGWVQGIVKQVKTS